MPDCFPAALFLPGDAFDTDSRQMMGRRVAGRQFACAMASQLCAGEELTAITIGADDPAGLQHLLQPYLPAGAGLRLMPGFDLHRLAEVGALHLPDPGLGHWSLLRGATKAHAFSLTGVIHTLCSERVLNALEDLLTAPLHPWDALVCTSQAGRAVVEAAQDQALERLRRRFASPHLQRPEGPQLPVIPLAIDPTPFRGDGDRQQRRRRARAELGLPMEAFVACFVGRLSFHSKAHPLVLYRTLAALARERPGVVLLECGHLFNASIAAAFDELGAAFPELSVKRLGGLQPATEASKVAALAAADVFVSPADNLQETFGLSLLEAMAAELPLVVSDWNGYRDLVVDGETGFLIPTADPLCAPHRPGALDALEINYRLGFVDYDSMIALRSLSVVVEEQPLLGALRTLRHDPGLAQRMGVAARQRLERLYSWRAVASQYRDLWTELARLRQREALRPQAPLSPPVAAYADLFAAYPSRPFSHNQAIRSEGATPPALLRSAMTAAFMQSLSHQRLDILIEHLQHHHDCNLSDLEALGVPPADAPALLAALIKLGVLELP